MPDGTEAVIVELGANDMLRGVDPKVTRKALEEIVRRLTERRIAVLLAGMRAAPNLGADYGRDFEAIYSDLAAKYDLLLYPFFLDGVAADSSSISAMACIRPPPASTASWPASCPRPRSWWRACAGSAARDASCRASGLDRAAAIED